MRIHHGALLQPTRTAIALMALGLVITGCSGDDGGASAVDLDSLTPAEAEGYQVIADNGCVACHITTADVVAPGWDDLMGTEVLLDDGTTVTVDREYLYQSIIDPQFQVVEGFAVVMPTVELEEHEINAAITYIESLSS